MKPSVDYTLYLVTDSTLAILGTKDLAKVVEDAIAGGKFEFDLIPSVTHVQLVSPLCSIVTKRAILGT